MVAFSPLIFCVRGVAVAHAFYKSSRGGLDFSPPALAQKSSCLLFSLPSSSPLHPAKRFTLLAAKAGDDAWPQQRDKVCPGRAREGWDPPPPHGCQVA